MDHWPRPGLTHGPHSFVPCDFEQAISLLRLQFALSTSCPWCACGIHQGDTRNAFRCKTIDLERYPASHRVPGQSKAFWSTVEYGLGHCVKRIQGAVVCDRDVGGAVKFPDLLFPNGVITEQPRHKDEMMLRHRTMRI